MKYRLIIMIFATVAILGVSVWETIYVKDTFGELEDRLTAQKDKEEYSLEEVTDLSEWWSGKSDVLEVFISVVQLNEITVTFGELIGAVKKEDYDSANALYERIYQYAIRIKEMYILKFNNIL